MSLITGNEPKHWHDENGKHCMPDPRKFGSPKHITCHGDADMAAYWDHLEAHDMLIEFPQRRADDSDAVKALFDKMENAEDVMRTAAKLIAALREQGK